jgi:hypothetical protein
MYRKEQAEEAEKLIEVKVLYYPWDFVDRRGLCRKVEFNVWELAYKEFKVIIILNVKVYISLL